MDKNILVQYKGGGYSGCMWEWNFFYIDKNGNFEDVFSSGYGGITTKLAATVLVTDGENSFSNKVYVYHLDNEVEMLEFAKETNTVLVAAVVKWFNDYNVPDVQPFAICSDCGRHIEDYDDICLEDWHGCGGIMSTSDTLLCSECRSNNSCGYCGEYYGPDDDDNKNFPTIEMIEEQYDLPKGLAQTVMDNNGPLCENCVETLLNEELDQLIKKTKK